MKKVLLVVIILGAGYYFWQQFQNNKLQVCPDRWTDNQELPIVPGKETQYFIIDGARRELDEFDLDWVKENCDIEPIIVQ
ncbi:MAG: hypothetical protein HOE19_00530 [Candidatus Komeilibacteria bacterium]|jgi:hypothetical protein|nr:hypothetical protein [Candidatus Komeilibacteria bacterium]MBT4447382.1 hypothetical protein [Candidatus Komeilibacteria bacterium]